MVVFAVGLFLSALPRQNKAEAVAVPYSLSDKESSAQTQSAPPEAHQQEGVSWAQAEKSLAAKRSGIKTVIIPKKNEADLSELPDEIIKSLTFILAEHIDDVLHHALIR
jgi:hypothetical protein